MEDGGQPVVARGALLCGVPQLSSSWIWCFENCQNCFSFSTNSTSAHSTPSQTPPAASLHQAWAAFPLPASR